MVDGIITYIVGLITGWGIAGTILAAFAGPVVVQRFVKPYFSDSTLGARGTKRRKLTLLLTSAVITFAASMMCLMKEYTDIHGILLVSAGVVIFQIAIVEWVLAMIDNHNPDLASKLSKGVYLGEDSTLMEKAAATLVLGTRECIREDDPDRTPWTPEQRKAYLKQQRESGNV